MAQTVQIPPNLIGGDVDEGYGKVADAFRRNLSSGQEVGAALAVYRDGRKVVDGRHKRTMRGLGQHGVKFRRSCARAKAT